MSEAKDSVTSTKDREITHTRLIDAPRELVWEVWTDPRHMAQWWGPDGFTNTIHEMEVKPGGVWRFVMHGPDGTEYPNKVVFQEVVRPERLVYSHVSGPLFHVVATFEPEDARTRFTLVMSFETMADYDIAVDRFGAIEGAKQTFGRMADHVVKLRVEARS